MLKTKIFNFSKPVDNFSSLFLDNGLASLAAAILEEGHNTCIEDYGRLEMVSFFQPPTELGDRLKELTEAMKHHSARGASFNPVGLKELRKVNGELKQFHRERIDRLAVKDAEDLFSDDIQVALFKVWNGLGTYYFVKTSEQIKALEKKERKKVYIFGGGPQVGWFNTFLLQAARHVDGLVLGEGEEAVKHLLRMVQGKESPENVPGLIFRQGETPQRNPPQWIKDLDRIAKPVYDPKVYPANRENQKIQFIMLDESRGCPNRCFFCNHFVESGGEWRTKSASRIVDEIEELIITLGTRYFRYSGSSTPPALRREIAEEIIRRGIRIRYTTFINTNTTQKEDLLIMKESGCFGVFFGIESGTEDILQRSIGTKNSKAGIRYAVQAAKEAGLYTVGSLIIPAPFDTPQTIKETLDFVISLGLDAAPVLPPGLTGTETLWARESERFGINKDSDWVNQMLFWDVNLLVPAVLWDPLPYTVNGKNFTDILMTTGEAAAGLLQQGIAQTSDEMALMACLSGRPSQDFLPWVNSLLKNADSEGLQKLILQINRALRREPLI